MTVQTSYSIDHGRAYAGMTDDQQVANFTSALNTGSATIPYGKGVVTSGNGADLPGGSSTAAEFMGVNRRVLDRAYQDGDTFGAPVDRDMTLQTMGTIWVVAAEDGIAKDDPAFLRVGSTNTGDWANDAGTGVTASVAIPNAKFLTAGDEGELVLLSLTVGG